MARRIMTIPPTSMRFLWVAALCLAAGVAARAEDARPPDAAPPGPDAAADEFRELRNLFRADPAKAAEGFRAFLERHPTGELADDAQYWLALSLDRSRAKRADVLAAWETLVEKNPDSPYLPDALFAVAEVWQTRAERPEDYTQAARAYQRFVERCPTDARVSEAEVRSGEICDRVKNHDQAIVWFRRVIDEHPQSPFAARARAGLAGVYLQTGKPDDALTLYEGLLAGNLPEPQRLTARLGVVDCFLAKQDGLVRALATCEAIRYEARQKRSLEDFAEFKTHEKMAMWYLDRKRYDDAEAEYQAYLARFPKSENSVQAKLAVGTIRLAAGKPAAAREMFHDVASGLEPGAERPAVNLLRAMLSEAYTWDLEMNYGEAKALYRKLAESWPRTNEAREARRRLERIERIDRSPAPPKPAAPDAK